MLVTDRSTPYTDRFPTTRWSQVLAAAVPAEPGARAALADLCAAYWYPVYAFVRRKGYDADAAQDLVQGFFADFLERDSLAGVGPAKGRFRAMLMASCSHYLSNRRDHDRAGKRGGGRTPVSIDRPAAEGGYLLEPCHELTAERLFERRWATTLLSRVVAKLESEMAADHKSALFEALRPRLLCEADGATYRQIADELGISEEAARAASARLRGRYRNLLHREVASTLDDPAMVDDEIRDLFGALA